MDNANYHSAYGVMARTVKATAVCVPLLGTPSATASTPGAVMISNLLGSGCHPHARIAQWAGTYKLTTSEIVRLASVIDECSPCEIEDELAAELRGVLAARKIASMKLPSDESLEAIRVAFEEGRFPVKSLPLD